MNWSRDGKLGRIGVWMAVIVAGLLPLLGPSLVSAGLTYAAHDLGTLGGPSSSYATGINNSGMILGFSGFLMLMTTRQRGQQFV